MFCEKHVFWRYSGQFFLQRNIFVLLQRSHCRKYPTSFLSKIDFGFSEIEVCQQLEQNFTPKYWSVIWNEWLALKITFETSLRNIVLYGFYHTLKSNFVASVHFHLNYPLVLKNMFTQSKNGCLKPMGTLNVCITQKT